MGNTLYLECNAGISGDMTVAALLDLGAKQEVLLHALKSLPVSGFDIEISRVKKAGLDVCDFHVKLDEAHENHDHDMEYLHGHEHHHHHEHSHEHHETHHHDEAQHIHGHHHHHEHRGLTEIQHLIEHADLTENARQTALRIFEILAEAEAKAHGVPLSEVHFHEVGAVDSIIDIVAVAVCLDSLQITEVIVPYLCEGQGTVRCQHGILPVPVPAVANIVEKHCLVVQRTEVHGELVTPTGAAIVAAIQTGSQLPEQFRVQKTGMGAGKRAYERPSILRAMLIEPVDVKERKKESDTILKMETNIDDCTGEILGYVMEELFENGARDVHYTPVFMKKNRPAYLLTVICDEDRAEKLQRILFNETTTIGIRKVKMERTVLEREIQTKKISAGEVQVKRCVLPDGLERYYPEYESVVRLAKETGKPVQEMIAVCKKEIADE